jgi:hypothetical protein
MKKITTLSIKIILVVSVLTFLSCKKKDTTANTTMPPTPMGTIAVHLHTNIDSTEADSGAVVLDNVSGKRFQLNLAQFYISGVVAYKADGTAEPISGAYALKTITQEMYIIGQVPTGNYSKISFNVGIDASTNATNPSAHTGILGLQNPSMWFGNTTQGYIFMNVQGYADTTANHTGTANQYFSYQLGGNAQLKTINMPTMTSNLAVTTSSTNALPAEFHIICDYGVLLNNINFKTQTTASPFGTSVEQATAEQIWNNLPNMFSYEM